MSGSLLQAEAGADAYYGLPSGTLEALGASESAQGTNLGTIGNIFQVLPSTATNPGYGLSSVNGNDPFSVGAYLSALINGPGGGSVQQGISLYQGGAAPNQTMSQFLNTLGGSGNSGGTVTGAAGTPATAPATAGGASSWLGALGSWAGGLASRAGLIVLAIILLLGAIYLFAGRTQQVQTS